MKSHSSVDNIENCEKNQRVFARQSETRWSIITWSGSTYIELGIEDNLHTHAHTQENGS
jgi:hypothetical protein